MTLEELHTFDHTNSPGTNLPPLDTILTLGADMMSSKQPTSRDNGKRKKLSHMKVYIVLLLIRRFHDFRPPSQTTFGQA